MAAAVFAVAAVGSPVFPSAAHAEAAVPGRVVDVTIAGSEDDLDVFLEALREPLETLGLRLRGASAEAGGAEDADLPPRDVRVWVDLRHEDRVDVLVRVGAPDGTRTARRSVLRDASRSRAVVAEDVAYSVRATLESLLLATVLALPPPPSPPTPPPPPTPTPTKEARFGLDAAAVANVRGVASGAAAFGGGVAADVAFWGRRRWHPMLWILGAFDAPFSSTTPEVSLETTVYSLRAVPGVEVIRAGPFRFAAGAGFGVDLFRVNPSQADVTPIVIRAPTTYADPILEAQLLTRLRLFESVGLLLALTLDYDTGPHEYFEFDQSGVRGNVLVPWRVRPAAYVGFCFRLTGASGCAGSP
jgi:hypothetical protein